MLIESEHSMARVESDGSGTAKERNGSVRTAEVMLVCLLGFFLWVDEVVLGKR